jgi:ABC-type antimicrobial peptide transport system permease subunit
VVGDVRQKGLDADVFPEIQMPYTQSAISGMTILIRTTADPLAVLPAIRSQVRTLDPDLPLTFVQTMNDVLANSVANRQFALRLLSAFAVVALMLTSIGVYGVMSAAIGDRRREIAVRLALGASPSRLQWMAVYQLSIVAAVGVLLGVVLAFAATRYLRPLLFGVPPTDASIYVSAGVILVAVTIVSGYLPARRITSVDAAAVLRAN